MGRQALQSVSAPVAVVGVLGSSLAVAGAFANRIIGRRAFHHSEESDEAEAQRRSQAVATIQAYYDPTKRCLYLLGVCHAIAMPAAGDADAELPLELVEFERERVRMQTLLLSSCHLVFLLKRNARTTTSDLKLVRNIAVEKAQILQQGSAGTSGGAKGNKRDSFSGRNSSSSSSSASSHTLAPGKCIPVAVFVIPAPSDAMLTASVKSRAATGSSAPNASRSATVTFCKSIETRLMTLFRSVRGAVGSARLRDALSAATMSKERRVFTLDPSHSVVMVSRRAMMSESVAERLLEVLDLADGSTDSDSDADDLDDLDAALDKMLAPLEDSDVGFSRAVQYHQRVIDHVLSAPGNSNKDAAGGRVEVLPLGQWLRAFIALAKSQDRVDDRRRSSVTSIDTER